MGEKNYKQLEFNFTRSLILESLEKQPNANSEPSSLCPICNSDLSNSGFTDLCIYCGYRFCSACGDT